MTIKELAKKDQRDSIIYKINCARDTDTLTLWMCDGSLIKNATKEEAIALDPMKISALGYNG